MRFFYYSVFCNLFCMIVSGRIVFSTPSRHPSTWRIARANRIICSSVKSDSFDVVGSPVIRAKYRLYAAVLFSNGGAYEYIAVAMVLFLYESERSNAQIAFMPVCSSGKTAKPPACPMAPLFSASFPWRMHPGLLFRHARVPPWRMICAPPAVVYTTL